jgi:hypothetical protein
MTFVLLPHVTVNDVFFRAAEKEYQLTGISAERSVTE